ncbi:MAG: hypothetical protein P9L92_03690 [Candidatus Electryonea clarkiae]|nr:hypothetical protein [Candidatus Electryonea clarkiae]MDP8288048.1 hypothetical protein [Candidatus Electryonea clarkiae]
MIKRWLKDKEVDPSPYVFRLINFSEKTPPDSDIKTFLGKEVLDLFRNLGFLKEHFQTEPREKLLKYLKEQVFPSANNLIDKNVFQGDFGEILASVIESSFYDLIVPLRKLRWKFNKNRSTFCTDMIAHDDISNISEIYYYEIKTRILIRKEKGNYITVNAHDSLLKDEQTPGEGIADFLSRYHYEKGEYAESSMYMDIVKNPQNYDRKFELFFIIEKSEFKKVILTELENLPPTLEPLGITIVLVDHLKQLIKEIRNYAISNAQEYISGES